MTTTATATKPQTYYVRRCVLSATGMDYITDEYALCERDDDRCIGEVNTPVKLREFTRLSPPDVRWISDAQVAAAVVLYQ